MQSVSTFAPKSRIRRTFAMALLVFGLASAALATPMTASASIDYQAASGQSVSAATTAGCVSSSVQDNGSDVFVQRKKHIVQNICSTTQRVKVGFVYYPGGSELPYSGYSSCVTLSSFASHVFTVEYFYLTQSGKKFDGTWKSC